MIYFLSFWVKLKDKQENYAWYKDKEIWFYCSFKIVSEIHFLRIIFLFHELRKCKVVNIDVHFIVCVKVRLFHLNKKSF